MKYGHHLVLAATCLFLCACSSTSSPSQLPPIIGLSRSDAAPIPAISPALTPSDGRPSLLNGISQPPQARPDQRDWQGAQVTLAIFSGRPDPSWSLPAEDAQELRRMLDGLPEAACRPVDLPLGYRGFVVVLGQRPELSNEYRLRAYAGQVRWGDPWDPQAPGACRSDAGRQVERALLAGGRNQLSEDIYAAVAGEIDKSAPDVTQTPAGR